MFTNIGKKIKVVAIICFFICAIASVAVGIALIVLDMTLEGVLTLLFGPLASWLMVLTLYGFGELIENTAAIAENTEKQLKLMVADTMDSTPNPQFETKERKPILDSSSDIRKKVITEVLTQGMDEDELENAPYADECPACFHHISETDTECPYCGFKLK